MPANWESQGYPTYDGYAWYRKKFYFPEEYGNQDLYLILGRIDDIDVTYLNGHKIGNVADSGHLLIVYALVAIDLGQFCVVNFVTMLLLE